MTDHADTIRRAIMVSLTVTGDAYTHDEYDAAHASLDALLAERQQAIDALREIAEGEIIGLEQAADIARAALLNLDEEQFTVKVEPA